MLKYSGHPVPPLRRLMIHRSAPSCGGGDENPHQQPFTVDQGVDLAALDPLAGVVTHLVVVPAPFSADLINGLSRTATEGLASRPICSRNAICSSPQIASPDAITLKLAEDVVDR